MKFRVYHKTKPNFRAHSDDCKFPVGYQLVANVECESLEQAFELTNSIERRWTENPEANPVNPYQQRSTSVGDVVVDPEGVTHYCEPAGWKQI